MRSIFILCFLGSVVWAGAQQLPQYSLYMLNPYSVNPAVAGTENTLLMNGVYRQQWSDLEGAPVGQQISAHLPVGRISSGFGIRMENDVIGAHRTVQAVLSYAFHRELGRSALLSLGVSGGYMQYTLDGAKLRAPQGTYAEPGGVFLHNDAFLPEGKVSAGVPVAEAGIYFQYRDLSVGAAVQPFFAPMLEATDGGRFRLKPGRHYLLYAAYDWELASELRFRPSILTKTDFFMTQLELSAIFQWRENIFAGASYRGVTQTAKDAVVFLAGWQVNERTTLAYAYDLPLSALQAAHRGSHELMLHYNLNKPIGRGKLPPVIYNPRFW